jgi:hypothetical protein
MKREKDRTFDRLPFASTSMLLPSIETISPALLVSPLAANAQTIPRTFSQLKHAYRSKAVRQDTAA